MPDWRVRKGKCPEIIMLYFAFLAKLERKYSTPYVIQNTLLVNFSSAMPFKVLL